MMLPKLKYHYILVIVTYFIKSNYAKLRACSDENIEYLELCHKGEKYVHPIPAVLTTMLHLNQIIKIDGNENSITVHMEFISSWKDPGISLSNATALE